MTAPTISGRRLTAIEQKVMLGYGRGMAIAAIAFQLGLPQEYIGEIVLDLCSLNRQQAAEVARNRRTLPVRSGPVRTIGPIPSNRPHPDRGESLLTVNERKVLELLATDRTMAAIAGELGVKIDTARTACSRLYDRLNLSTGGRNGGTRRAAVEEGIRLGLIAEPAAGVVPVDEVVQEQAPVVVETVRDVGSGAGHASESATSVPEPVMPVKRRRKPTDAEWWAALSKDEQARVLKLAGLR